MNNDIEVIMKTAFMERVKARTCYINSATGHFLEYNQKKYIITCRHVADDFFNKRDQYVLLRNNKKIFQDNLKYIERTSEDIDIALIEVLESNDIKKCFTMDDINVLNNFSDTVCDESNFFVFGYPEQLKYSNEGKECILWMSFLTVKNKSVASNENFLYLDYPREGGNTIINESGLKTTLPKAPGLSVAFIFQINTFVNIKTEIWDPSISKIVAMQSSWNKKNWLKGCNIKFLVELLEK